MTSSSVDRDTGKATAALNPGNGSMMTLSSAPTLMPSSAETSGMAPRAEEGAELPERQEAAVEEAAGEHDPEDAERDIENAGQRFGDAEGGEADPCPGVRDQLEQ